MKTKELVALVTGASSGIGKATAERLAMSGYDGVNRLMVNRVAYEFHLGSVQS